MKQILLVGWLTITLVKSAHADNWWAYASHSNTCLNDDPSQPEQMIAALNQLNVPFTTRTESDAAAEVQEMDVLYQRIDGSQKMDRFFKTQAECLQFRQFAMQNGIAFADDE